MSFERLVWYRVAIQVADCLPSEAGMFNLHLVGMLTHWMHIHGRRKRGAPLLR